MRSNGLMQPLMEEPGDGGGNGNGNGDADRKFTQADLDRVVQTRLAEERRRGNIKPEEVEELANLRTFKTEKERKEAEAAQNYELAKKSLEDAHKLTVQQLTGKISSLTDRYSNLTIKQRIEATAAPSVNDPTEISALLSGRVKLDDDFNPIVLDEHNKPAFVNGVAMTVEQLVVAFLANPAKKHLLRPTQQKPPNANNGENTGDEGDGTITDADQKELNRLKGDWDKATKNAHARPGDANLITLAMTAERKYNEKKHELNKKGK